LLWEGFEVVHIDQADHTAYQQTLITDLTDTTKGSPVNLLARILRVNRANILPADTASDNIDFRVVVGYDFQPCYKSYWYAVHPPPAPAATAPSP
jgi:hypothetical protein